MIRRILGFSQRQIHVFSTDIIKPSKPTPPHLKTYNLSPMDQFSPRAYIPIVFFYPYYQCDIKEKTFVQRLKYSLSQTLTDYYPFAGRQTSVSYIDCNDQGVEFQEAQVQSKLCEVVENSEDETLDLVIPPGLSWHAVGNDAPLIVVRLTHFNCGGIALALCMSHKLADAYAFATFVCYWAKLTYHSIKQIETNCTKVIYRQSSEQILTPHFILWPFHEAIVPSGPDKTQTWLTKRFVFSNSKVDQLKAMVHESGVENVTRVGVLTALLYKCATDGLKSLSNSFEPAFLNQLVNMRSKMVPSLPNSSTGNIYWKITVPTESENVSSLEIITDRLIKGKVQIEGLKMEDWNQPNFALKEFVYNLEHKMFISSSLCGFPFYDVNFGWGKPMKVCLKGTMMDNMFILKDAANGDGIEVMVSLKEEEMMAFQCHKKLLLFASV